MHGDERVARADRSDVEIERLRIDVDESDSSIDPERAVRARDERQRRRRDDVVASDPRGPQRGVQRDRSVGERHRMRGSGGHAQRVLEFLDRGALGEPIAAQHRHDGGDVVVVDQLVPVRNHRITPPGPARRASRAVAAP
jgi:hypothetical protein